MPADAELCVTKIRTCFFNKVILCFLEFFKLLHCAYGAVALPYLQNMSRLLLSNLDWFLFMILQWRSYVFINGVTGTVVTVLTGLSVKCYERPQQLSHYISSLVYRFYLNFRGIWFIGTVNEQKNVARDYGHCCHRNYKSDRSIRNATKGCGICQISLYRCCMKLQKNENLKTAKRPYRKLLYSQQEEVLRDYLIQISATAFQIEIWKVLHISLHFTIN